MNQELQVMDEEQEQQKKVVFRFDIDDIEKLKIIAARKHTTQNDCFNEAMKDYFKKYEKLWK